MQKCGIVRMHLKRGSVEKRGDKQGEGPGMNSLGTVGRLAREEQKYLKSVVSCFSGNLNPEVISPSPFLTCFGSADL